MSKVTTVSEALSMTPGLPIPTLKGRITKVFKPITGIAKSGVSKGKPYRFENGILSDGKNEIKFSLKNREPLDPKLIGEEVYITAHQGDKGWTGVVLKMDKYKDKQSGEEIENLVVDVTKTGEITRAGAKPGEDDPPPDDDTDASYDPEDTDPGPEPEEEPPKQKASPPPQQKAAADTNDLHEIKVRAAKLNTLLEIAEMASNVGRENFEARFNEPMPSEHFQGRTMSIFIALSRWVIDTGRIDKVPNQIPAKKQ